MANVLAPTPKQFFLDNAGNPAVGFKVFTYSAGTSTKLATYTDAAGGTPNSNPIILDYRGSANIWIPPNTSYKFVLADKNDTDPPGHPIWTVDGITSTQLLTLYGGVDTGSSNAYVLNFTANFSSLTDGIIIYWVPANTNNSAFSTLNVNGLGPVTILQYNGDSVQEGDIIANTVVGVIYRGGNFYLLSPTQVTGSFTGTLTGMTTTVTGLIYYTLTNNVVTLFVLAPLTGTSNTTAMSLTGIPAFLIGSLTGQRVTTCPVISNAITLFGGVTVDDFSNTVVFSTMAVSGASLLYNGLFNAAGQKGLPSGWQISYSL